MIQGSLARRYARALMAIGRDKDNFELLGAELALIASLAEEDDALRIVVEAPIVSKEIREKIIEAICEAGGFNQITLHFLKLLNTKGRLPFLKNISSF